MNEEELLAQAASLEPVWIDGFSCYRKVNGVMRCIGWQLDIGARLNLIVSLAGAEAANREHRQVLNETEPAKGVVIWGGSATAH